mgnify:CR=1 FL=1
MDVLDEGVCAVPPADGSSGGGRIGATGHVVDVTKLRHPPPPGFLASLPADRVTKRACRWHCGLLLTLLTLIGGVATSAVLGVECLTTALARLNGADNPDRLDSLRMRCYTTVLAPSLAAAVIHTISLCVFFCSRRGVRVLQMPAPLAALPGYCTALRAALPALLFRVRASHRPEDGALRAIMGLDHPVVTHQRVVSVPLLQAQDAAAVNTATPLPGGAAHSTAAAIGAAARASVTPLLVRLSEGPVMVISRVILQPGDAATYAALNGMHAELTETSAGLDAEVSVDMELFLPGATFHACRLFVPTNGEPGTPSSRLARNFDALWFHPAVATTFAVLGGAWLYWLVADRRLTVVHFDCFKVVWAHDRLVDADAVNSDGDSEPPAVSTPPPVVVAAPAVMTMSAAPARRGGGGRRDGGGAGSAITTPPPAPAAAVATIVSPLRMVAVAPATGAVQAAPDPSGSVPAVMPPPQQPAPPATPRRRGTSRPPVVSTAAIVAAATVAALTSSPTVANPLRLAAGGSGGGGGGAGSTRMRAAARGRRTPTIRVVRSPLVGEALSPLPSPAGSVSSTDPAPHAARPPPPAGEGGGSSSSGGGGGSSGSGGTLAAPPAGRVVAEGAVPAAAPVVGGGSAEVVLPLAAALVPCMAPAPPPPRVSGGSPRFVDDGDENPTALVV